MAADHWVVGVGLGRFWDYFTEYRLDTYYTRYPHSVLLEVAAELGVVGAAAFAGFLGAAGAAAARALREPGEAAPLDPLRLSVALAALLLLAHAMVDIDWHAPANPILFLLLVALAEGDEEPERPRTPAPGAAPPC